MEFFKRNRLAGVASVSLWIAVCVGPLSATSVRPSGFSKMAAEAELIVEGTVVDLQVVSTGDDLPRAADPIEHRAPARSAKAEGSAVEPPQSVGVEGGKMLFTEVTLAVDREISGSAGSLVKFRVAGGSDGELRVKVHGLPSFELDRRYLVFLRPGFEAYGDPIVGVNQGFFEVVPGENGEQYLLDAKGDVVVGVEGDRVICRHGAERSGRPVPRLGPAPVPEPGSQVKASQSPEVMRYWRSEEAPLVVDDFVAKIRAIREEIQ